MKRMTKYITSSELYNARVKFYSYIIEPCTITWNDGRKESRWDGSVRLILESGEEAVWEYGNDRDPGKVLEEMECYINAFNLVIV